jgi:hypothetical protein
MTPWGIAATQHLVAVLPGRSSDGAKDQVAEADDPRASADDFRDVLNRIGDHAVLKVDRGDDVE